MYMQVNFSVNEQVVWWIHLLDCFFLSFLNDQFLFLKPCFSLTNLQLNLSLFIHVHFVMIWISQYTHTHTHSNTIVSITYLSGLQYLPANVGFSWWMGGWSRETSCRQKTRKIMQMKSRRVLSIQSFLPALSYQQLRLSGKDLKFWNERISLSDPTIRQDNVITKGFLSYSGSSLTEVAGLGCGGCTTKSSEMSDSSPSSSFRRRSP